MRRLKAQQITEFMLAVPLLIVFFAVLTEYAYTFNSNLVLSNAVKSSIGAYMSAINTDAQKTDYQNAISDYIANDMRKNKLPNLSSLETQLITVDKHPVVVGSYTYKPGFGFAFLPALKSINMSAVTIFPFQELDMTCYESGISTGTLNSILPDPSTDDKEGSSGDDSGSGDEEETETGGGEE